MIYFDSNYLVRLYYQDSGYETVRQLATTTTLACSLHGRAEVVAALHRKLHENHLTPVSYAVVLKEFTREIHANAFHWLPLSQAVFAHIEHIYATLPATIFLRAADALHLACAATNGFKEIYSNDERLLAAAKYFKIKGVNVI